MKRPTSFRAPYLVIDKATIWLLEKFGFIVDSSFPAYKGTPPIPQRINSIIEIPVSCVPTPHLIFKLFVPLFRYRMFTMEEICNYDPLKIVRCVVAFQLENNVTPHVVFLAHPWEFKNNGSYCSEKNYIRIRNMLNELEKNYNVKYVTMNKLAMVLMEDGSNSNRL